MKIRNFSIIAHIDHGKSTLADCMLRLGGLLDERTAVSQYLDRMDLERERGITIKAQAVRIPWRGEDGLEYQFNLIDTPGHVDFSYEVSRSLSACEGALLVVDASQGVQAQTVANAYLAIDAGLDIIPVLNKVDLPAADPERTRHQLQEVLGLDAAAAVEISAKRNIGVERVMAQVIAGIRPPQGGPDAPLRALIFDSWFDSYQGVIVLVRVFDGTIEKGMPIRLMQVQKEYEVQEVGIFSPDARPVPRLSAGEVGFVIATIKDIRNARIGDTITGRERPTLVPFPGFKKPKSMVFSGVYPVDNDQFQPLRDALEKLQLNDYSFRFEPEASQALGFGFRCGYLGLLHMDIVRERLEREFDLSLVNTAPTVEYRVVKTNGEVVTIDNPARLPSGAEIEHIEEPFIRATVSVPDEHVGPVLTLCQERRGEQVGISYTSDKRVFIEYLLPLNEIVLDFYDRLKTVSRGYASMDYDFHEFRQSDLVKLDILINGSPVDALSVICHRSTSWQRGHALCVKLKDLIPRQMFEVAIQAAIGTRVITRTNVKALRKNVTSKCYGGDITRKRKLLEKQKAGKKRMKQIGNVEMPQEAFLAVLKLDD